MVKAKTQPDKSAHTAESSSGKANQIMDDLETAAANLDAHINSLRVAGFFKLEHSILLAKQGLSELRLDEKGKLSYSPEESSQDADSLLSHPTYTQVTGYARPITTIKAITIFDVRECVHNIHKTLDELLPIAKRKREESEVDLERVAMRPDPPKALPPIRKKA